MRAGQEIKMLPGAVAACALPVGLGLLATVGLLSSAQPGGFFMTLPVSLCFVFGAPLSAWLACRRLRKIDDPVRLAWWRSSIWAGLLWSSFVHFSAALVYTVVFTIWAARDSGQSWSGMDQDLFGVFFMSGFINIGLWCVLTLPFALICATIFWKVTTFPEDVNVF